MNDLQEVLLRCQELKIYIKTILKKSTYTEYDDMSGLQIDYEDPDQMFLLEELRGIMENLSNAFRY